MAEWPVASVQRSSDLVDYDAWEAAGRDPWLYVLEMRRRGELAPTVLVTMPPPFQLPLYPVSTPLGGPTA